MRKMTGIVLAIVLASVMLSGCYSKSCDQPAPMPYKDSAK